MLTINIKAQHSFLIGDALSQVPWMKFLCDEYNAQAVVTGNFNGPVARLLSQSYPFMFAETAIGKFDATFEVNVAALFGYSGKCHMSQCFFHGANKPLPELPIQLDLRTQPCGLPSGVVISPFSRSDQNQNKLWPHERWISVVQSLRAGGLIDRVYIVGSYIHDDPAPYIEAGMELVFDRQLAEVLDLMRRAPLVLTIDNGMSHLAHYGGISTHVLLYPGCLPACWVNNPRAVTVCEGNPINVQPYHILQAARIVLGRPYGS